MPGVRSNTKFRCKPCGAIYDFTDPFTARPCIHCGQIKYESIVVQPVCDFCSTEESEGWWTYPCEDFDYAIQVPGYPTSGSVGGWDACLDCHRLIHADDRRGLAARSVDADIKRNPGTDEHRAFLVAMTRSMHNGFFQHRTGEPIPKGGL